VRETCDTRYETVDVIVGVGPSGPSDEIMVYGMEKHEIVYDLSAGTSL